jgi:hypothetical protein
MTSYFTPLHTKSAESLALAMQSLFLSGRVLPSAPTRRISRKFSNFRRKLLDFELLNAHRMPRSGTKKPSSADHSRRSPQ